MQAAVAVALPLLSAAGAGATFASLPPLPLFSADADGSSQRIFSFTNKRTKLRVELTFAIPFVSIPLDGRKKDEALLDVNLGALGAGALFSLAALLFIPNVFDGLKPELNFGSEKEEEGKEGKERWQRSAWSSEDAALHAHRVDASACAQRALCSLAASASAAASARQIINIVDSNQWLSGVLRRTSMKDAIDNGRFGGNCTSLYDTCLLPDPRLQTVIKELSNMIKN